MNIGPGVSLKQLNEEVQERIQWHREMELSDTAAKAKIGLLVGAGVTITGAIGAIALAGPGAAAAAAMVKSAPLSYGAYVMVAGTGVANLVDNFSGKFQRALDQARKAITGHSVLNESFQKHAHQVPDHITVTARQRDFGLTSKEQRCIAPNIGDTPESL